MTLEDDCNSVFIADKSADGFTVKELQRGTSNALFSWPIVQTEQAQQMRMGTLFLKILV